MVDNVGTSELTPIGGWNSEVRIELPAFFELPLCLLNSPQMPKRGCAYQSWFQIIGSHANSCSGGLYRILMPISVEAGVGEPSAVKKIAGVVRV